MIAAATIMHHKMILIESDQFILVMIMGLSPRQIAKALDVSEMTISGAVVALGCENRPLSPFDEFKLFLHAELHWSAGLSPKPASELIAEFHQETMFVAKGEGHRVWLASIRCGDKQMRVAAMSVAHLISLIDAHPAGTIIPFHEIGNRARARMQGLKGGKAAA